MYQMIVSSGELTWHALRGGHAAKQFGETGTTLALQGIDKSRVLKVGDAFETDIRGAANYGIDSLLIAGGIHDSELQPLCGETMKLILTVELEGWKAPTR